MNANEYQRLAARTLLDAPEQPLSGREHMEANIAKLRERYPDGWDANRSHAAGEPPVEDDTEPPGGGS